MDEEWGQTLGSGSCLFPAVKGMTLLFKRTPKGFWERSQAASKMDLFSLSLGEPKVGRLSLRVQSKGICLSPLELRRRIPKGLPLSGKAQFVGRYPYPPGSQGSDGKEQPPLRLWRPEGSIWKVERFPPPLKARALLKRNPLQFHVGLKFHP